jgi:hypothetical protein
VREPATARKVLELFKDRRQAADEPDSTYERAARVVQQAGRWPEVAPRLDTAIALRALIWPDVLAAGAVTALSIISPSTVLIVILAVLVVLFPVLITSFRGAKLEHLDALYRSAIELLHTPNHYYCYISTRKLDQLVGTAVAEPATPAAGEEGTRYGPPGLLLRADAGRELAARLQLAIRKLEGQRGGLPDLEEAIKDGNLRPGAYRHSGRYKVTRYDDRFVYLQSKLTGGVLKLTCSVSHFSRTATEDGKLDLHSGNVDFLTGEAQAEFRAIVFLTDVRKLVGTPLYLALPLESRLSL